MCVQRDLSLRVEMGFQKIRRQIDTDLVRLSESPVSLTAPRVERSLLRTHASALQGWVDWLPRNRQLLADPLMLRRRSARRCASWNCGFCFSAQRPS